MKILFCTSNKIGARGIRLVTWSDWSHVAIIDGDEGIEAVWPMVKITSLAEVLASHTDYCVVDIPCQNEEAALAWARSQVGKPYDLLGMLGLGFHRDWQNDSDWWCSELVTRAAMNGGNKLFRDGLLHRITPQHLWMLNYPVVVWPMHRIG